ncbi:MAG: hydrogenase maturation protease [Syntrophobacterales bacterium]|jgi:hydrogenase maturation protease|nr:hydrogenase maturation protease [Syntrophobacterales bacterium]
MKVIGVGNEWRGDDAAGLLVARGLAAEKLSQVEVVECRGTAGEVQDAFNGADGVIVVDAVSSGGPPGTRYRFDAHQGEVPMEFSRSPSSHGWGVAEALALARVLGELPPLLIIYGIEGQNFDSGRDLSPEVAAAIPEMVRRIKQEIRERLKGVPRPERRTDGT